MSYHWTKSKYRKTHLILFFIKIFGVLPVVTLAYLFFFYFGEGFIPITLALFTIFFWFVFLDELSVYLTGEVILILGSLDIERKKKGSGSLAMIAVNSAKTSLFWAVIFALSFSLIQMYR